MTIGTIVGHSYFGKGQIIGIDANQIVVDFKYPFGIKVLCCSEVQIIPY